MGTEVFIGLAIGFALNEIWNRFSKGRSGDPSPQPLIRHVLDAIPSPVFFKNRAGRYLGANQAFLDFTGKTSKEMIGKTVEEIWEADLARTYREADNALFASGGVQIYEAKVTSAQGIRQDVLFQKSVLDTEDDTIMVGAMLDITARKAIEARFRSAFDQSSTMMCLLDRKELRILELNQAFTRGMEIELEDLPDHSLNSLGLKLENSYLEELIHSLGPGQSLKDQPVSWANSSPTPRRGLLSVVEISTTPADLLLICIQDMSEILLSREELARSKEAAEAASRAKSVFLANMSHEIRTPLNGILGMADLLLHLELGNEEKEYARTIRQSGEDLNKILNDILDLSRIEGGKFSIQHLPFSPKELVQDVLKILSPSAWQKDLQISFFHDGLKSEYVRGDVTRFRQIVFHLLSNAIKFTNEGQVEVRLLRQEEPWVMLEVRDTGIGIQEKMRTRLFEPFFQVDGSSTRQYGGIGIGLSICQQLAHHMGGKIEVLNDSRPGSCFQVLLPLPECSAPLNPARPRTETESPVLKGRILVAEDHATNQRVIQRLLNRLGLQTVVVSNGKEALETLKQQSFDLILMDLFMPVMNGWEASRLIRDGEAGKCAQKTPIIALSAAAYDEDQIRSKNSGIQYHLMKPISLESLYKTLILFLPLKEDESESHCA